jgi:hypothetical protein
MYVDDILGVCLEKILDSELAKATKLLNVFFEKQTVVVAKQRPSLDTG